MAGGVSHSSQVSEAGRIAQKTDIAAVTAGISGKTLAAVFQKAEFWKKHATANINERQRDILNRLFDGFEGKLTSTKWAILEKCSPDTALRDINELVELGIRKKDAGGRSTGYSLC
jgi:Fic family protein